MLLSAAKIIIVQKRENLNLLLAGNIYWDTYLKSMSILKWSFFVMLTLSPPLHAEECVILLHGLARNDNSLKKLELILKSKDYHTVNYNYPSTRYRVAKLAEDTISDALSRCIKGNKITSENLNENRMFQIQQQLLGT